MSWAPSLAALVLATSAAVTPLPAQTDSSATCTYDACGLRLDRSRLLRGAAGTEVGRLQLWGGPRLSDLVMASDSARSYARIFDENYNSRVP